MSDYNVSVFELGRACGLIINAYMHDEDFRNALVASINSALAHSMKDFDVNRQCDKILGKFIADWVLGVESTQKDG